MALPAEKVPYTYADYLTWDEADRFELVDGEVLMMAPPSRWHQRICVKLATQLETYLEGKTCEVYTSPFAVRLFEEERDRPEDVQTVVEPDLVVICDPKKLDDRGCRGAPDLVIEILSPSTQRWDRVGKYSLYQRSGVREYWLVNPEDQTVQVFLRKEGHFQPQEFYGREDMAAVNVLEDCTIDLSRVFLS